MKHLVGTRALTAIICGKNAPGEKQRLLAANLAIYFKNIATLDETLLKTHDPLPGKTKKPSPVKTAQAILEQEAAKDDVTYSFSMASGDYSFLEKTPHSVLESAVANAKLYSEKHEKRISFLTRLAPNMVVGPASGGFGFAIGAALCPQGLGLVAPYAAGFVGALASLTIYVSVVVGLVKYSSKKSLLSLDVSMPLEYIMEQQKPT